MKKLILILSLMFTSLLGFSCHYSYLTLNGGPTAIGGGLYSTDVTVCIGQKQNWGGTSNFTLCFDVPISSASGPNFPNVTNTYNICGGPCGPTQSVTATATGTIAGNCITYTTTSSTPAGYPLVPDRYDGGAGAAGNSNSFCFTITIVTVGYPSTLSLAGNVEADPGISGNDGTHLPCNGNPYDANMTINFAVLPIVLEDFNGYNNGGVNHIEWITRTEINNEFFTLERSRDAQIWKEIETIQGAGNSNNLITYQYKDDSYASGTNYYRLTQTDFNGQFEVFETISITTPNVTYLDYYTINLMGQVESNDYTGIRIVIWNDGARRLLQAGQKTPLRVK